MVVLHELAHIKRRHFLWRMLPVGLALAVGTMVWSLAETVGYSGELLSVKLAVGGVVSATLLWSLGAMARHCELDADRAACFLAAEATDWSGVRSPARVLASALAVLLYGCNPQRATWLHPSLQQRLNALRQLDIQVFGSLNDASCLAADPHSGLIDSNVVPW
jgi:Zn-dependent protease with chaperone function